jgi:hypothetical protein
MLCSALLWGRLWEWEGAQRGIVCGYKQKQNAVFSGRQSTTTPPYQVSSPRCRPDPCHWAAYHLRNRAAVCPSRAQRPSNGSPQHASALCVACAPLDIPHPHLPLLLLLPTCMHPVNTCRACVYRLRASTRPQPPRQQANTMTDHTQSLCLRLKHCLKPPQGSCCCDHGT